MDEILTTARDLELEVNKDDIEELIMGHEDELTTEELQEILNEEHQETAKLIFPFRVTIGTAESHDTAARIMKDQPPYLTVGRRQSQSYVWAGVLQTCIRPIVGKRVKDDSSDHITVFHCSNDQVL
ncbi:hypothetical protein TNCV_3662991 [Trichonephila clavipes]|nr:hypothetical protein TNCV_3662991 [Trichonephila clavipes]